MIFITNTTNIFYRDLEAEIQYLEIQMLNPKYPEEREVFSFLDVNNYDPQTRLLDQNKCNSSWQGTGIMNYTGYYKFKKQMNSEGKCNVNYKVSVTFDNPDQPTAKNCQIQIAIESSNIDDCEVNFSATMSIDSANYQLQMVYYCLFVNLICACQFIFVTKLCKDLMFDQVENIQRISLVTVGYITIYDSYLCLLHLYFALLNYLYFQYLIMPALFYFLLSTTCDMKLLWIVWKERFENEQLDQQQQRRKLTIFFIYFYTALVGYLILMYFFTLSNAFNLMNSLFMVPQIIHNVSRGNNPKFLTEYIFGILGSTILIPLYFHGCPANFWGLQPSVMFCCVIISLYALQIFVLFIQYIYGPRSIIPKQFLPKQYDYFQKFEIGKDSLEIDECAICIGSLLMEPEQLESNLDQKFIAKQILVTPCKHKFHISCLRSWMDVKLSCPTCRKDLPPLNI